MKTFIRNGIKTNFRAGGRTVLFFALIFLLSVSSMLAFGVRLYCDSMLAQCDAQYRTTALIEYLGADFPDEDAADPYARAALASLDTEAIRKIPGVRSIDLGGDGFGFIEGSSRVSSRSPYYRYGVIEARGFSEPKYQRTIVYDDEESGEWHYEYNENVVYYSARISAIHYSRTVTKEILIFVLPGESGFTPEEGKHYVLNGVFLNKNDVEGLEGKRDIFQVLDFEESDEAPYAESPGDGVLPEAFSEAMEAYQVGTGFVYVKYGRSLQDQYDFQQGLAYLREGSLPEEADEHSCVISGDLADTLSLHVGDTFSLEELVSAENSRYRLHRTGKEKTLTITGVTDVNSGITGTVWLSCEKPEQPLFGYTIASAALENEKASDAVSKMEKLMPENVRISLLDQGYQDASQPFSDMRRTASRILVLCSAGAISVLLLFAYLFIGRQSFQAQIMISLGTPKKGVILWLLSGTVLIAGTACLLGGIAGMLGLPVVLERMEAAFAKREQIQTLYSETVLGVLHEAVLETGIRTGRVWAVSGCLFLLSVLLCLLFLPRVFRESLRKRGVSRVRIPHGKTSDKGRGSLRFARLSILRGGLRSLAVPAVSLVMTVIMILFGGIYGGWQDQLTDALENTRISGIVTSLNGRYYSDLVIPADTVRDLKKLDDISDVYVSVSFTYWLDDEMPAFANTSFGEESRAEWIQSQPDIVAANSLLGTKEFYYTEPVIDWLEGWDESCLSSEVPDALNLHMGLTEEDPTTYTYPAVFSREFLEEHGLSLGDTVWVQFLENRFFDIATSFPVKLMAVGSYKQNTGRAQIYVPLAFACPPDVTGENEWDYTHYGLDNLKDILDLYYYQKFTFGTCRFVLSSAQRLDESRLKLKEAGFSSVGTVGKKRTTVILRDASFMKLTGTMKRYISTGHVVLLLICAVTILTGGIISFLMIQGRRREFALMRGFGAGKLKVFLSFFLEQMLLCLSGALPGCLLLLSGTGRIRILLAAAFVLFYLIGSAVAILILGRTDLMALLSSKE